MKFALCILGKLQNTSFFKDIDEDYISEIITISDLNFPKNIEKKLIKPNFSTQSTSMNDFLNPTTSDHIIWLDENTRISNDLFEEYSELIEEESPDFIYPNLIIQGKIKNFTQWKYQKIELVQSFHLEEEIPNIGIYTNKQKFNSFDDSMGSYTLYDFLYKNIKNLNITLSELSFVETDKIHSFKDTSYNSKTLRDILNIYDFQNELFYHLDWKREEIAYATAYTLVGNRLMEYNDYYNAANFFRKALLSFHNQESLKNLVFAYYKMGLFDEAKRFLNEENTESNLKKTFLEKIKKTEELIKKLESLIETNKFDTALIDDILESYDGAPINNLIAATYIYTNNLEEGYKYLYKAATQNPIDKQILENLATLAKHLKKEDEVMGLYNRLLH